MTRALLLDLDDTLVVEEPAAVAAFAATAAAAAERHPLDPRRLALDARACARELWHDAEVCAFGRRIGISSWEALWCRYEGDEQELRAMREWAPGFRRDTWRAWSLERPRRRLQYGTSVQCAEPVTGSSSIPARGAKKRETKS